MNPRRLGTMLAAVMAAQVGAGDTATQGKQSVYDFEMNAIDGKRVKLSSFKDHVLLIVNVASK